MAFRTLLAMATKNQWSIGGLDVQTAYLYASLDEKEDGLILVQPPSILRKLWIVPPEVLWKLKKS
eukprot:12926321-Prorocentrum_lima.AAC.1